MKKLLQALPAWGALILLLVVSVGGYLYLESDNRRQAQHAFAEEAEEIGRDRVEMNVELLTNSLLSIRGLFAASQLVELHEWETFITNLATIKKYAEILSYSYWEVDSRNGEGQLRMRYRVIAPTGRELPSELRVDERMRQAAEDDKLVTIDLLGEEGEAGFLLLMTPVYGQDGEWRGFVSAGMRRPDLFTFLLGDDLRGSSETRVELSDTGGERLYDSRPEGWPETFLAVADLTSVRGVALGDQIWTLTISAPAYFSLSNAQAAAPKLVLIFGSLVAWLIFGLIRLTTAAEQRSRQLAQELAERLAARERARLYGAADPIVVIDTEGVFQSVNAAAVKLFGYPVERVLKRNFSQLEFLPPESLKKAAEEFNKVRLGVYEPFELEVVRSDGKRLTVEVSSGPITEMQEVLGYQLIMRDVTERKRLAELLRKEQAKTKMYIDTAGVMLLALDDQGKITLINKKGLEMLGYGEEELVGQNWFDRCVPVESRDRVKEVFDRLMGGETELLQTYENPVVTQSGDKLMVRFNNTPIYDDQGKIIGTLSSGDDVTEERKLETRVREDKAMDEALLEGIGEGVIGVDKQGRVIYLNKAARGFWREKTTVDPESLIGRSLEEAFPNFNEKGEQIGAKEGLLTLAIETGQVQITSDLYVKDSGGQLVPIALVASPIILNGEVNGVILSFRDIIREKEIDRAKTEFVSMASHQLRTPLSVVSWYTEMLLDQEAGQLSEDQRKYLEQIYVSNKRLIELVNALLNVSRIEMGTMAIEPKDSDLRQLIEELVEELRPKMTEKGLTLVKTIDEKIGLTPIDPNLFRVVMHNLLTNAIKYSSRDKSIEVRMYLENDNIVVAVADSGVGIPAKDQALVFKKLFRAENAKISDPEGTGLGLYIAKEVVKSFGGRIWFESVENQGSTFYFSIPKGGMVRRGGTKTLV